MAAHIIIHQPHDKTSLTAMRLKLLGGCDEKLSVGRRQEYGISGLGLKGSEKFAEFGGNDRAEFARVCAGDR
ncbi:hypothetical protein [Bradyrhizobium sp. SZCCHNR1015]|uniref:hypothetical protein n=1 Tax=Bradyrhizobium sp. SZCCHNR1015 TaxID=3057338 RepID=UPI002916D64B|nr:hypothetical protein [Bradyrhizobium sp. SZCCHNR1015]